MKFYEFGNKHNPVILLLPGTCCHWKVNYGGKIHAAYGCSLGGSFVGLLVQRGRVHIDHAMAFVKRESIRNQFYSDLVTSLENNIAVSGTGVLTMPVYRTLPEAEITCLDYSQGQNRRTDWFINKLYTPKGFFTPPYETIDSLRSRLGELYLQATVETVEAMASFVCRK